MSPEEYQKVDSIFQKAVKLSGEALRVYLTRACGADTQLRTRVEALLRADAAKGLVNGFAGDALGTDQLADAVNQWNNPSTPEKKAMRRCSNGHYFDESRHQNCPYCPIRGLEIDRTMAFQGAPPPPPPSQFASSGFASAGPSQTADSTTTHVASGDDAVTQVYIGDNKSFNPVVGWLVCIEGPDRGRDYRIRSQRNFIGRDQKMDICISGDQEISRENHVEITYDPRGNAFRVAPGISRSLAYLNGALLEGPARLNGMDIIELGRTQLRFVPFCGETFKWD